VAGAGPRHFSIIQNSPFLIVQRVYKGSGNNLHGDFFQTVAEHFGKSAIDVYDPSGLDIQNDNAVDEMLQKSQRETFPGCVVNCGTAGISPLRRETLQP
jgi:hypothetical protein